METKAGAAVRTLFALRARRVRVRGCTRVPSSGWLGEPMKGNEKPVAGRSHDGF